MKAPAFQFYTGDWMKDPALRACTVAARGLWIDMLSLMFESHRRGYLQHPNGKPVTAAQLARMTGCATDEASLLLRELEDAGVYSTTDDGVIYSRRLVRDEHKRQLCREAGKKGGNPTLKGGVNGGPKGQPKGGSKRNPTPSSSSSTSVKDKEPPASQEGGGPPAAEPPPARRVSDSPHPQAVAAFCEAWAARYGRKYPFNGAKDGDAVRWMLGQVGGDPVRFAEVARRYLAEDDELAVRLGHNLGLLRSQFPRWLVGPPAGPTRSPPRARSFAEREEDYLVHTLATVGDDDD